MSAADLVARLAQETIDPKLLAEIAQELFCGEAERKALADRRRSERDRKANQRVKSREVTGQHGKSGDKGSNDRDILTSKSLPPKPSGLAPKPKKHRLPIGWQPAPFTAGTHAEQTVQRWEPGRMERELSKFRDHHTAAGTQWENWQAAWSKWVNGSNDFERGRSGTGNSTGGKSAQAFAMLNPSATDTF